MGLLGTSDFVVSTRLGVEQFDRRADGRARVRAVVSEARRIRRADPRVRRVILRRVRGDRDGFVVDVVIRSQTGWTALACGSAVVRSAIHAVGGSTVGWDTIEPFLIGSAAGSGWPSGSPSWADASARARRHMSSAPVLPPFGATHESGVIDLR